MAEASRRLERHPTYFGRVFRRALALKVEEVFELLALLNLAPWEFFEACFPLGGDLVSEMRVRSAHASPGGESPVTRTRELMRQAMGQYPQAEFTAADWAARTGELLREKVKAAGLTQRQLSTRLGMSRDALGQALRGQKRLTFELVFQLLPELQLSPGRFFAELVLPDRTLAGRLRWSQLLADLDRLLATTASRLLTKSPTDQS